MTNSQLPKPTMRGEYAGFVSRFLAYAIDLTIIVVVQFAFLFGLQIALNLFGLEEVVAQVFDASSTTEPAVWGTILRWVVFFVGGLAFFGAYLVFLWTVLGRTIGQAMLGLLVVGVDGSRVTFWVAVRRAIGYYLSFLPLLAGYFWVLVDDRRQGWHDKLAGTVVVYDWDARIGRRLLEYQAQQGQIPDETTNELAGQRVESGPLRSYSSSAVPDQITNVDYSNRRR